MLLTLLVTTCVPFVITAVDAVAACAFLGRVDTSAGLFTNTLYTLVNMDTYCIVFAFIIYSLLLYSVRLMILAGMHIFATYDFTIKLLWRNKCYQTQTMLNCSTDCT